MKITLIVVGKLKEEALNQLQFLYLKKIKPYVSLRIEEVPDFPLRKNQNPEIVKNMESAFIRKKLSDQSVCVVLDIQGKMKSSEDFAMQIEKWQGQSVKELSFIVGGAYGVSEDLLRHAHLRLSLSKMTFTHEMARVLLLEQIYRAFTILKKVPYHHAG